MDIAVVLKTIIRRKALDRNGGFTVIFRIDLGDSACSRPDQKNN